MPIKKEEILQKLKTIKPELQARHQLTELALFGSYARDEQTAESDIDIMVNTANKSFRNYLAVIDLLELQFPDFQIQVVSKGAIKPNYFEYVKSDLLYV